MNGITTDPIGYSEALQNAGMPKAQADLIARTEQTREENLTASRDIATRRDLAEMEVRITRAMYNAMFGLVAAVAAIAGVIIAIIK